MCGISGFCNLPHNWHENIERMNRRMYHRGPDEDGVWFDESVSIVLGHRRLSILDLSQTGKQPMRSHSERYIISFNGEIYNFQELKNQLLKDKKVLQFYGHSDTEVLLEFVESYGVDETLSKAKGMFAFALYDREEQCLMLVRDRIGEKPLYYGFINGGFVFASEISAIEQLDCFEGTIDRKALSLFFRHGYIPAPYSVYENIRKLDAGSILEIKYPFNEISVRKYWDILDIAKRKKENPFTGSLEEASDRLEELLTESIKLQMVADVPVGAFLSGGIDSTTIVALMQKVSDIPVKTFSIGFGEEKYNEAQYARETAAFLGTDHTELYVTDNDALEVIPSISRLYGEPFADSSQIPTYLVSKLAKSKVTVSLSGDAGDELFGGYGTYPKIDSIWRHIRNIPLPLRKIIKDGMMPVDSIHKLHLIRHYLDASDPSELYVKTTNVFESIDSIVMDSNIPSYKMNGYLAGRFSKDVRDDIMLIDLMVYHPDDILVKVDRSGMAVSLESRIPFLDRDVVEFSLSLPIEYKIYNGVQKKVLKNVLYKYLPESMMNRPKKGFSIPVSEWLRSGKLQNWMNESLEDYKIRQEGILDSSIVSNIKEAFLNTGRYADKIWYLCIFEQWLGERLSS